MTRFYIYKFTSGGDGLPDEPHRLVAEVFCVDEDTADELARNICGDGYTYSVAYADHIDSHEAHQ